MRDRLPCFDYYAPATLAEATHLLASKEGAVVLQGGTDLWVATKQKGLRPQSVVSLKKLRPLLSTIEEEDDRTLIGASTTFSQIERSLLIERRFPVLHESVRQIASYQIRNTATIGGNLCNASPAADSAPPLLVLDATLVIQGPGGQRELPIDGFFKGPGKTALDRGEMLTHISLPNPPPGAGAAFVKLGRRISEDISIASAAAWVLLKGHRVEDVKIALGSVAPTPLRARHAEDALKGGTPSESSYEEAGQAAMQECRPITDVRASADYRRAMVRVLTKNALKKAVERATEA